MTAISSAEADVPLRHDAIRFHSVPLGGSPLARAMIAGDVPPAWGGRGPVDQSGWRARAAALRAEAARLRIAPEAFGPTLPAPLRERLARHANGEGFVVTTGQQPGLFGGPAYSLTKALAARALAHELEALLGEPVTPVFWAATDDTDWLEAATVHVAGDAGLEALSLAGPPTEGRPLGDVPVGAIDAAFARFAHACGSAADQPLLELVERAFAADALLGTAYCTLLRELLEPLGMPVLDAWHPATREAMHPFARQALGHAGEIDAALRRRAAAIEAAGFTPQVDLVDGLSPVFQTIGDERTRVPIADAAAVAASARDGTLGGNVLLRPALERAVLPTLAYVAGPGELAYFAQVGAVANAARLAAPVAVPRVGITWETPTLREALERLDIPRESLADEHRVSRELARRALDPAVADAVQRLRTTLDTQIAQIRHAVHADDALIPDAVVDGVSRDVAHRIDRLERRILAAEKRRGQEWQRTLAVARAEYAPLGKSPERVLSLIPLLVRYGRERLVDAAVIARAHARELVYGSTGGLG